MGPVPNINSLTKVVTLGEIMLRISTPGFKHFVQADTFDNTYGGGEANVSAALCNYGLNGTFVTKVPDIPIGQAAATHQAWSAIISKTVNEIFPEKRWAISSRATLLCLRSEAVPALQHDSYCIYCLQKLNNRKNSDS